MSNYQSGVPYGDAIIVQTPKLDQARQQLYAEQQQRRMYQQRDAEQVDQQIGRQFSRIRSVDAPDIIGAYNQYKGLQKQLLFDPKIQNNPQAYNDTQQQANEALGKVFQQADQSAQYNQMGKDLFTSYITHPDRYADNFVDIMKNFQNTPMGKLQNHPTGDLSNPDTYMYKGSNTDFGKLNKAAIGTPHIVYSAEEPVDANNLQTKITPYSYGNTPAQYYQTMLGSLQQRGAGRDAAANWEHMQSTTPGLIDHVNQEYDKITPEIWKQMTGSEKPQIINPDPTNNADQFAAFQAKAYALNNLPQEGKAVFRNNQANIISTKNAQSEKMQAARFQQQKLMEGIRQNDRQANIGLHRLYAKQDAQGQQDLVDQHFNDEYDQAKKNPPVSIPTASGKPLVGFETNPVSAIKKEFQVKVGSHLEDPDKIVVSPDGKTMTGIFLTTAKDGSAIVDDSKTKQKDVNLELKPVFRNFVAPKSKVPVEQPKPKVPVNNLVHKEMFNDIK
jgi:hypothetical protein